jgi:ribonuclease HI
MIERRKPDSLAAPRATAMIFADASFCHKTKAAGWGAWVKRDDRVSEAFGGSFRDTMPNSTDAELCALANALHRALARRMIEPGDVVMLQSDSLGALVRIRSTIPATFDNPARGGLAVGVSRKATGRDVAQAAADRIKALADGANLTLVTRHVRGHQEGGGRHWVNETCDQIAKAGMRKARDALLAPPPARLEDQSEAA